MRIIWIHCKRTVSHETLVAKKEEVTKIRDFIKKKEKNIRIAYGMRPPGGTQNLSASWTQEVGHAKRNCRIAIGTLYTRDAKTVHCSVQASG